MNSAPSSLPDLEITEIPQEILEINLKLFMSIHKATAMVIIAT